MENDVYNFFKFQSFVLEFCRLRAMKEHQTCQRLALEAAEKKSKEIGVKQKPEAVNFRINVQSIGISL